MEPCEQDNPCTRLEKNITNGSFTEYKYTKHDYYNAIHQIEFKYIKQLVTTWSKTDYIDELSRFLKIYSLYDHTAKNIKILFELFINKCTERELFKELINFTNIMNTKRSDAYITNTYSKDNFDRLLHSKYIRENISELAEINPYWIIEPDSSIAGDFMKYCCENEKFELFVKLDSQIDKYCFNSEYLCEFIEYCKPNNVDLFSKLNGCWLVKNFCDDILCSDITSKYYKDEHNPDVFKWFIHECCRTNNVEALIRFKRNEYAYLSCCSQEIVVNKMLFEFFEKDMNCKLFSKLEGDLKNDLNKDNPERFNKLLETFIKKCITDDKISLISKFKPIPYTYLNIFDTYFTEIIDKCIEKKDIKTLRRMFESHKIGYRLSDKTHSVRADEFIDYYEETMEYIIS